MQRKPRKIIQYYRFQNLSSINEDSSEEPCLQPVEKEPNIKMPGGMVLGTGNKLNEDGEAEVPRSFEYFEEGLDLDSVEGNAPSFHEPTAPILLLRKPTPEDLGKLEPLEYHPLDPERLPVRLLAILPHFGNPYSTVQCNLFSLSFHEQHYCYAAITQTRGNKILKGSIIVNCKVKQVTRNLEIFLRHFRKKEIATLVWIREVCISAEDDPIHQTPGWRDWIIKNACDTLSMPDIMEMLQEQGILEKEKQITIREKDWSKVIRYDLPTHFPIPLRTLTAVELASDDRAIERTAHAYVPLDLVAEEIRLVVLLPAANHTDPLFAHFAHESIYGKASYQCLSYTWGTGEATSELTLNGQIFHIRKNLDDALRSIRGKVSKTTFWIDAICIDQDNVLERSRQVARMHHIYKSADCVIVWLGEADEDSDLALDSIASASGYIGMDSSFEYTGWDDGEAGVPEPFEYFEHTLQSDDKDTSLLETLTDKSRNSSPAAQGKGKCVLEDELQSLSLVGVKESANLARCWAAICRLLQRPYFRRMWIVQEIAAASVPTVWCGKRRVAWGDLHSACLSLMTHWESVSKMWEKFGIQFDVQRKGKEIDDGSKCQEMIHPRYDITSAHRFSYLRQMGLLKTPLSFLFLALLHRQSECTDPRDKIYALWNLANDAKGLKMVPDYSLSVRNLYISFTKQYILNHHCLDIICAPQVRYTKPLEGGLPSWVPDWRTTSHMNGYLRPEILPATDVHELEDLDAPLYRASRSTKAAVGFFQNDEWLVCGGILMDTVSFTSPESGNFYDWYPTVLKQCHDFDKEISEKKVNRDFWSMTLGDETSSWEHHPEKGWRMIEKIQWKKSSKTVQIFSDQNAIMSNVKGRRLIFTKKGFMGLAPSWAEIGNTLAILFGCNVPVLLGKCRGESTHFHLKGDCFVQGWMRGEMLDAYGDVGDEEIVKEVLLDRPGIQIC